MNKADEFDNIVRGTGAPASTGGFYNPRHAQRMPRETIKAIAYIYRLLRGWLLKSRG